MFSLLCIAEAQGFLLLLAAFMLFNPASGSFVSLAQASLMDLHPTRREPMMARWTVAGTTSHIVGPVLLVLMAQSSYGWRGAFAASAFLTLFGLGAVVLLRRHIPSVQLQSENIPLAPAIIQVLAELKQPLVVKWIIAIEVADLLLDIFTGLLGLYLVDVVGLSIEQVASFILVRSASALLGEVFVAYLLERVRGISYLYWSSIVAGVSYVVFLATTNLWIIYPTLALVSFATAGWYSVLKANLYGALPNRSGSVMVLHAATGLIAGLLPFLLGVVADQIGLSPTVKLLSVAPLVIFVLARLEKRRENSSTVSRNG